MTQTRLVLAGLLIAGCAEDQTRTAYGQTAGATEGNADDGGDTGRATETDDGDESETETDASESDSDSDASTSGGGSGTGGVMCEEGMESHVLEVTPPSVMLVLDKSGSMAWVWDHDGDTNTAPVTRWSSLYHVVQDITTGFGQSVHFGAQLFPKTDAPSTLPGACDMDPQSPEVEVAPNNAPGILTGIPGPAADVFGGTPATPGIERAVGHLTTLDPESPKAMILITDGAPNCKAGEQDIDLNQVPDDNLPVVVGQAHDLDSIPTFVIGIGIVDEVLDGPVVNPFEMLNEVAVAGGVPQQGNEKFYNVSNETELQGALETITGFIECTIALDAEPEFPEHVTVTVNGEDVPAVEDCENEDGWRYLGEQSYDTIVLCGTACSPAQAVTEVDVQLGCP